MRHKSLRLVVLVFAERCFEPFSMTLGTLNCGASSLTACSTFFLFAARVSKSEPAAAWQLVSRSPC